VRKEAEKDERRRNEIHRFRKRGGRKGRRLWKQQPSFAKSLKRRPNGRQRRQVFILIKLLVRKRVTRRSRTTERPKPRRVQRLVVTELAEMGLVRGSGSVVMAMSRSNVVCITLSKMVHVVVVVEAIRMK